MQLSSLSTGMYLMTLFLISCLSQAAPPDVSKASSLSDVSGIEGQYDDLSEDPEVGKRLSSFVRIGRPNNFVRIGRNPKLVRTGRQSNFVRIGRGYEGDVNDLAYDLDGADDQFADKRASRFVRIGKASRFVRIGKSDLLEPEDKRMSSFVRIGKSGTYDSLDSDDVNKRASSFVRIGRIPSSAFVRIGRDSAENSGEPEDFGTFDRMARMGQSSFVRIGKREAVPEATAKQAQSATKQ